MMNEKQYPALLLQWLQRLYWLLFLSLPFSLDMPVAGAMVSVPAEPLMLLIALLAGVTAWKYNFEWRSYVRHPVTIVLVVYLLWMAVTTPFSTMLLTSVKFLIISLLHWWACFLGILILADAAAKSKGKTVAGPGIREDIGLLNAYLLSFLLIIFYAWWIHSHYYFLPTTSNLAARPFYFDHTAYSACMALLIWVPWLMSPGSERPEIAIPSDRFIKFLTGEFWRTSPWKINLVRFLLGLGIFLSFCRATWLGMAAAAGIWLFRYIWEKNRIWAGGIVLIMALTLLTATVFNNSHRHPGGDISSQERFNRYSCAWRMFLDKPLTGFGAGTFPDQYLAYQRPEEMTRISVTHGGLHQPGRGGTTHSEYLQALAELGFAGALCWVALAALVVTYAFRYPLRSPATMIALCLLTYMVHVCFNNFLHTDKIGGLVWVLLALLVLSKRKE